ncbi:penicillin-binding protein activator [Alginatibacterium sediminis]|uniref:penicillin-binding protein activator n=1 Tax=Alginatibacterium sediminis TaxID=2164068 RepID=UPI00131478E5|nr:penicillin-binding protein activator [Alginatibacterium sediminis]
MLRSIRLIYQWPLILCLVLLLNACASNSTSSDTSSQFPGFAQPTTQSPDEYLRLAKRSKGDAAFNWQLLAAKAYIGLDQLQPAQAILESLEEQANSNQTVAGHKLVQAELLFAQNLANQSLQLLSFDPMWQLSNDYWLSYYQQRATIYQLLNNPVAEVQERVELDKRLTDASDQLANNQQIWSQLKPLNAYTLRSFQGTSDSVFNGWLEVAAIVNEPKRNPQQLFDNLAQWENDYPNHPALQFVQVDIGSAMNAQRYAPQRVAVLLPLSGRFKASANAVRDGMLAAQYDERTDAALRNSQLSFIDTEANQGPALRQAIEGATPDFIIGPLRKDQVLWLQQQQLQTPWMALNQAEHSAQNGQFYFGLSPEDEAQQAAQEIFDQSLSMPLIIAPQSTIGQRMTNAFIERWKRLSDEPYESIYYSNNKELQGAIRNLLLVDESQARVRQAQQLLGFNIGTETRSRGDTQAIYIIGNNNETKLIKPSIEVAVSPFAQLPQLFASSRSYQRGSVDDEVELQGLWISEMPWMLDHSSAFYQQYNQLWPEYNESHRRLFALGFDALLVLPNLDQMRGYTDFKIDGLSGALSVSQTGAVERELTWARYQDGELRPMDYVSPIVENDVDIDSQDLEADEAIEALNPEDEVSGIEIVPVDDSSTDGEIQSLGFEVETVE